jgi:hypothetical protein
VLPSRLSARFRKPPAAHYTSIVILKETKSEYSELEAATELGITVEELRAIIRNHIVKNDTELHSTAVETFHPSDLLLLRILAKS